MSGWSLSLREGKNREVKNVLGALGLVVNRLIRVSYGPFQLGDLPIGGVEVVKARVLREQLGKKLAEEAGVDFDSELPEPVAITQARRAVDPNQRASAPGREASAPRPRGRQVDAEELVPRRQVREERPVRHRPGRPDMGAAPRAAEAGEACRRRPAAHPVRDDGREVDIRRRSRQRPLASAATMMMFPRRRSARGYRHAKVASRAVAHVRHAATMTVRVHRAAIAPSARALVIATVRRVRPVRSVIATVRRVRPVRSVIAPLAARVRMVVAPRAPPVMAPRPWPPPRRWTPAARATSATGQPVAPARIAVAPHAQREIVRHAAHAPMGHRAPDKPPAIVPRAVQAVLPEVRVRVVRHGAPAARRAARVRVGQPAPARGPKPGGDRPRRASAQGLTVRIVAGRFRGKHLLTPEDDSIRPTADRVRESMFNILASRLGPELRRAAGARSVRRHRRARPRGPVARGGANRVRRYRRGRARPHPRPYRGVRGRGIAKLLRRDATALGPSGTMGAFDLIFLDPPYNQGLAERALVSAREGGWLKPETILVLEEAREATVTLPPGFVVDDRREYGAAAVHLVSLS